ncbi:MAG: hypothetical protein AVDCRST_MAG68-5595 [uncultured Gemmatimonadetes bacterium]|uniref:Uncharacterized protein n=1 Tax=uncultured Gemmatimonadota bacterium TaxID=203437 RepID=A0A6J4MXB6_9BACT|nr:MAG: hypothetical protein AVDCRST_MAG68-5595 [uncultured Gemmatimonadota bacterium]
MGHTETQRHRDKGPHRLVRPLIASARPLAAFTPLPRKRVWRYSC